MNSEPAEPADEPESLVVRANRLLDPAVSGDDPADDAYEVAKAFLN